MFVALCIEQSGRGWYSQQDLVAYDLWSGFEDIET